MIRRLEPGDGADLHLVIRDALGYDIDEALIRERIEALGDGGASAAWVAQEDGAAVGYIHAALYPSLYLGKMANIMALAVAPGYQGRGIGRALLERAEAWAKENGCTGMRLNSGDERTGAHAFYRSCGYTVRKEQKQFIKRFD